MQTLLLKQEENVLYLMCLGGDPSWNWFWLENPFNLFQAPVPWSVHVGTRVPHLHMIPHQNIWMG